MEKSFPALIGLALIVCITLVLTSPTGTAITESMLSASETTEAKPKFTDIVPDDGTKAYDLAAEVARSMDGPITFFDLETALRAAHVTKEEWELIKPYLDKAGYLPKSYTLGSTIRLSGLEITFEEAYTFTAVDNNTDVIRVGVTVKNISDEKRSLATPSYECFGSQGLSLDSVAHYFDDEAGNQSNMKTGKPGAVQQGAFYLLYDGDGSYCIEFFDGRISVEFPVTK